MYVEAASLIRQVQTKIKSLLRNMTLKKTLQVNTCFSLQMQNQELFNTSTLH